MTQHRQIRTLRHARTSQVTLGQNPAHKLAATHALCHYPSGAIYTFIPKNACTTMRLSLAMDHGCIVAPETEWAWVHANNGTFSATLPELINAPFTFVILRCPYARLASVFLDKIVGRTEVAWKLHKRQWEQIELDTLTFRKFVDIVLKTKERTADIHWRPQVDMLVYDAYDAVYSMADPGTAFAEITAKTGMPIVDARPLSQHGTEHLQAAESVCFADTRVQKLAQMRRTGRIPRHADLYDLKLYKKVGEAYSDDVDLYTDWVGAAGLMTPADLP